METLNAVALSMGAGWASGINLYAAVLMLGILQATGQIHLPPDLQILAHPLVMAAAGIMYLIEFFVDKIPGVDTGWDTLHTFVRIPAGAILAAGAVSEIGPAAEVAAALLGGTLAAGSHATKAGSRVVINTSPAVVTGTWTASIAEDVAVIGGLWAALYNPWLFLGLLAIFIVLAAWLLPKIWRGIRWVFGGLARLFGGGQSNPPLA